MKNFSIIYAILDINQISSQVDHENLILLVEIDYFSAFLKFEQNLLENKRRGTVEGNSSSEPLNIDSKTSNEGFNKRLLPPKDPKLKNSSCSPNPSKSLKNRNCIKSSIISRSTTKLKDKNLNSIDTTPIAKSKTTKIDEELVVIRNKEDTTAKQSISTSLSNSNIKPKYNSPSKHKLKIKKLGKKKTVHFDQRFRDHNNDHFKED